MYVRMNRRWICTAPASAMEAPAKVAAAKSRAGARPAPVGGADDLADVDLGELGQEQVAGDAPADEGDDAAGRDAPQLDRLDGLGLRSQGDEPLTQLPHDRLGRLERDAGVGAQRDGLEHGHRSQDGVLAEGGDGRVHGALGSHGERHRGEQLGEVDAQADVVGGDVAAAEPRERDPAAVVDEDRRRSELAVHEASTVQGGGEAPDRGEPGVVEVAVDAH